MFKRLFGLAAVAGAAAVGAKVVSDILKADEEEQKIINLEEPQAEEPAEEAEPQVEEEQPEE